VLAAFAIGAIAFVTALRPVEAELENHVFTSRADRIRLVVPRGWRESDAPSYPGVLLWLMRPDTKIVLTAEPFTRALYCSWPITCRTSHEVNTVEAKLACALRQKLVDEGMHIAPIQEGPKENEEAGLASVWFDYDDGKHFMRQAVALGEDRAFSLVMESSSAEVRNSQIRAFEQTLRTLRPLTEAELGAPPAPGTSLVAPGNDAGVADAAAVIIGDGGRIAAATGSATAAAGSGAGSGAPSPAPYPSAPAAKINPIGPCTK
jgi:hypothetical protein